VKAKKLFGLWCVGFASLGLYLLIAVRYPLGPSLVNPRASWTSLVSADWLNGAGHLLIYLVLCLLYLLAFYLLTPAHGVSDSNRSVWITSTFVLWLACSAVLMFAAPAGESHDVFDYLFRGRMMAEYHANPLADVPTSFSSAPYNLYLAWQEHVDTYGPVWEAASLGIAKSVHQAASWLGWWDESQPVCPKSAQSCRLLVMYITAYRLLAVALTGISGWFVMSIVGRSQPAWAPLALAAWLFNPLMLIASAVGGHNDTAMLSLSLFGFWLLQRRQPLAALLMLILAAHVKLTALIWLSVFALWIVRQWGWRRALKIGLIAVVGGLALSWLLYAPFGGWQTLPRMLHERSLFLANSVWRILEYDLIYNRHWPQSTAHAFSVGLPTWLFAAGALLIPLWTFDFRPKRWQSASTLLEDGERRLWYTLTAVSLLYLVVGSFWFQHWYVLWILASAVLLPDNRFTRSMLPWLVFGALASNAAMDFLLASVLKTSAPLYKYVWTVVILWTPVLLATGFLFIRSRNTASAGSLAARTRFLLTFGSARPKNQRQPAAQGQRPDVDENIPPEAFREQPDECVAGVKQPGSGFKEHIMEEDEEPAKGKQG
jgi:hypothetical protein